MIPDSPGKNYRGFFLTCVSFQLLNNGKSEVSCRNLFNKPNQMYKGEPTQGIDFYNLLFQSDEFTRELGKMTLASSKLEASLVKYLGKQGINISPTLTLGRLISIAEKKSALEKSLVVSLKMVNGQRNEFTHRIYSLFTGLVDGKKLPISNLLDTDLVTYNDYIWQLTENLLHLAEALSDT